MEKKLFLEAVAAREKAYAPYSHFRVGAALLAKSGKVYHGCNVENAAYTPTNCAERTAFFKAVSEGEREFVAIAIAAGPEGEALAFTSPCGVCRQVMAEFCSPESFQIIMGTEPEQLKVCALKELLPFSFGPENLA
jgi:cytidine deaminase